MNLKERWRDIKEYEGLYQISNLGRVKNLKRKRILSPRQMSSYRGVTLSKEGKKKNFLIHRLVAKAFIPNSEGKKEVNHIDGNKNNNNVLNLEWTTRKENEIHAYNTEFARRRLGKDNNRSHKIIQIDPYSKKTVGIFYGTGEIYRQYGYHHSPIIRCCNNKRKTAYKYIWQYEI